MTEMDLVAIQPRSFKPRTTESRHTLGYNENLLLEAPPPDGVNQLWVGDITYVPLAGSGVFLYLAILMDCIHVGLLAGTYKIICRNPLFYRRCEPPSFRA